MIIKCPECGHQVSDKADVCPSCGIRIAGSIIRCPHCDSTMLSDQEVCPVCLQSRYAPVDHHDADADTSTDADTGANTATDAAGTATADRQSDAATIAQRRKYHRLFVVLCTAAVIVMTTVFAGLYVYIHMQEQNELAAYENALQSSEAAVLQNFLDIYPDAAPERRDSITARLEALKQIDTVWQHTAKECTRAALNAISACIRKACT